jgi:uncharacterized membrane protein
MTETPKGRHGGLPLRLAAWKLLLIISFRLLQIRLATLRAGGHSGPLLRGDL